MDSDSTSSRTTSTPIRNRVIGPRHAGPVCVHHSDRRAEFRCGKCGTHRCVDCARLAEFSGTRVRICECTGACESIGDAVRLRSRPRFSAQLVGAIAWPFRRESLVVLSISAFAYSLLEFFTGGGGFALVAPIGFAFALLASGYVVEFAFQIIARTADGHDELPDWPDIMDLWDGALRPLLVLLALGTVCSAPAALAMLVTRGAWWVAIPFAVAGLVGFVVTVASLSIHGGLEAIAPRSLAALVANNGRATILTALAIVVLSITHLSVQAILDVIAQWVPVVPSLLGSFLGLAATVLAARWIGLMLRERVAREIAGE